MAQRQKIAVLLWIEGEGERGRGTMVVFQCQQFREIVEKKKKKKGKKRGRGKNKMSWKKWRAIKVYKGRPPHTEGNASLDNQ